VEPVAVGRHPVIGKQAAPHITLQLGVDLLGLHLHAICPLVLDLKQVSITVLPWF